MGKFDSIKMQDLIEVKDPDNDGGVTLVFKENKSIQLKVVDGNLVSEVKE